MGIAERREREREALRTRIVEAARDILSAEGLDGLSMRAIAERVEYSPATIYLYFRDKDELVREVVEEGFSRLAAFTEEELGKLGEGANAAEQHRGLGRAYARFALENTAYFRVMFELPTVAQVECREDLPREARPDHGWCMVVDTVQRAIDEGLFQIRDARRGALIAWGLIHGLTSLYLSGHLFEVRTNEEFMDLVEGAMDSLGMGWVPRPPRPEEGV